MCNHRHPSKPHACGRSVLPKTIPLLVFLASWVKYRPLFKVSSSNRTDIVLCPASFFIQLESISRIAFFVPHYNSVFKFTLARLRVSHSFFPSKTRFERVSVVDFTLRSLGDAPIINITTNMRVPNSFFGIRDLAYFKAGNWGFEGKGGRDSGL